MPFVYHLTIMDQDEMTENRKKQRENTWPAN